MKRMAKYLTTFLRIGFNETFKVWFEIKLEGRSEHKEPNEEPGEFKDVEIWGSIDNGPGSSWGLVYIEDLQIEVGGMTLVPGPGGHWEVPGGPTLELPGNYRIKRKFSSMNTELNYLITSV